MQAEEDLETVRRNSGADEAELKLANDETKEAKRKANQLSKKLKVLGP